VWHAPGMSSLYEKDFYSWTIEQAEALRAAGKARLDTPRVVDWEAVAEAIESLGRSQASELGSRYYRLLTHLLKWQYRPKKRSRSWRATIVEQRTGLVDLLEENPGLLPMRASAFAKAYDNARKLASAETGLPIRTFPEASPFSLEDAMNEDFFPEPEA
jgi:hypothetical protein